MAGMMMLASSGPQLSSPLLLGFRASTAMRGLVIMKSRFSDVCICFTFSMMSSWVIAAYDVLERSLSGYGCDAKVATAEDGKALGTFAQASFNVFLVALELEALKLCVLVVYAVR